MTLKRDKDKNGKSIYKGAETNRTKGNITRTRVSGINSFLEIIYGLALVTVFIAVISIIVAFAADSPADRAVSISVLIISLSVCVTSFMTYNLFRIIGAIEENTYETNLLLKELVNSNSKNKETINLEQ